MTAEDGDRLARLVLDGIALAEERAAGPRLLAATLTLVVQDEDGEILVMTASDPDEADT